MMKGSVELLEMFVQKHSFNNYKTAPEMVS